MKAKYLLRGIGIGLIIGVLIMFSAFKALELTDNKKNKEENISEEITSSVTTEEISTELITTEELTTEEVTTEELTTEEVTTEASTTATITVKRGMGSTSVAKMLQDKGIVDDYKDFDRWLDSKKYSTKINVGTFSFEKGMTYEEIAKILTNR